MCRLFLVIGLAVVAFACSEQAGQMLVDGGQMMMDAGDAMVPDAGAQDTPVECNKSETVDQLTYRWVEFPVTPGQTEVTISHSGDPEATVSYGRRDTCNRFVAAWFDGTSTGYWPCGTETPDQWIGKPKSITVHS